MTTPAKPILKVSYSTFVNINHAYQGQGHEVVIDNKWYHIRWFLDSKFQRYYVASKLMKRSVKPLGEVKLVVV